MSDMCLSCEWFSLSLMHYSQNALARPASTPLGQQSQIESLPLPSSLFALLSLHRLFAHILAPCFELFTVLFHLFYVLFCFVFQGDKRPQAQQTRNHARGVWEGEARCHCGEIDLWREGLVDPETADKWLRRRRRTVQSWGLKKKQKTLWDAQATSSAQLEIQALVA